MAKFKAVDDDDYIPFEDGLMEQDDGAPEPIWLGEDENGDDIDIDVCLRCGRYYGCTQSLVNIWRNSSLYSDKRIMPQLCFKCMTEEYGDGD